jgi:pimeloyl-ACP methyl ester carboxylesterase
MGRHEGPSGDAWWLPFLAGVVAGGAGLVLAKAFAPRRALDPRLFRARGTNPETSPAVVVPGILGSELLRPDGTQVWLNAGNALGHHDLALPVSTPVDAAEEGLRPGGLLGTAAVLPRVFGFTEYADLLDLLRGTELAHHVFTYDWRRDLVASARRLGVTLDALAESRGDEDARFDVIGHSMGGLVARYYLRFGDAEPDSPVTWAGARRIRNLVLVATPSGGSIASLDAILNGNRVGLSSTTLAASVIATMPSIYQLLPPAGVGALLGHKLQPLHVDLHDPGTWERFGWGSFAPSSGSRQRPLPNAIGDEAARANLVAALARARAFHLALARPVPCPCPVRVVALGGDCLPTLARALVAEKRGVPPRFEPWTRAESAAMMDAGDGRVTRASVLAAHLPEAGTSEMGSGVAELSQAFFGCADHHGIYGEPTFQSVLLRALLRPARRSANM